MNCCEDRLESISALIDGELTEPEKAELAAHLEICEPCRAALDDFRAISGAMSESDAPAPAELAPGIMFKARAKKTGIPMWKRITGVAAMAAACIVIMIVMSGHGKFSDMRPMPDAAPPQPMADSYFSGIVENSQESRLFDAAGGEYTTGDSGDAVLFDECYTESLLYPTPLPDPNAALPPAAVDSGDASLSENGGLIVYGACEFFRDDTSVFSVRLSGDTSAALDYFSKNNVILLVSEGQLSVSLTQAELELAIEGIPIRLLTEPETYKTGTFEGTVVIE